MTAARRRRYRWASRRRRSLRLLGRQPYDFPQFAVTTGGMDHRRTTVEQFTAQAPGFSAAASSNQLAAMRMLIDAAKMRAADRVLDVACGPGIVAAAFAREGVTSVTGIDLTPAMIALAKQRCAEEDLRNVSFDVGDVEQLPYADGAFTLVVCRYALHHMPDPQRVLAEMRRVCAPGGRVVIADVVVGADPAVAERFNAADRARDPSHVRAMTAQELIELMAAAGFTGCARVASYRLAQELEQILRRSASPNPAGVRMRFERAIDDQATHGLGLGERRDGTTVRFEFPVNVLAGQCPG